MIPTPIELPPEALVTEPGIYRMSMTRYHGQPCAGLSVSSTNLRRAFNHLGQFWSTWSGNPDRVEDPETEAMILGRAAHHLLLGESGWRAQFSVRPEKIAGRQWHGSMTEARHWLANEELAGRTVVTPAQVKQIRGMAASLERDPLVKSGLLDGVIEASLIWKDAETGLWMKVRPDAIPRSGTDVADLKCLHDVEEDELARTIYSMGYHQQLALIREGFNVVLGIAPDTLSLVCVEQKEPHAVEVRPLADYDLDRGHRQNRVARRLIAKHIASGAPWPGPNPFRALGSTISIPTWAAAKIDRRCEQLEALL